MAVQFYICSKCKKIISIIQKSACATVCCGEDMQELKANITDGATEKHVPVVSVNGNQVEVRVGSAEHPMAEDHWIEWIALETKHGVQRKTLNPGERPFAAFALADDVAVAAYAYCNKHGLWKKDI